jgi:hypothetical protein
MKNKLLNWLEEYFSFVVFGFIFLIGIGYIFINNMIWAGVLYCVATIGASINNYIQLKGITWSEIKWQLIMSYLFRK